MPDPMLDELRAELAADLPHNRDACGRIACAMLAEVDRLRAAVCELEELTSEANERANANAREIHSLRAALAEVTGERDMARAELTDADRRLNEAVEAEREACADICFNISVPWYSSEAYACEQAIRGRGEQ